MLFNSLQYAYFLPLVVVAYYLAPRRTRLVLLLGASYLFYASWSPLFLLLIIGLTVFNFVWGLFLGRVRNRHSTLKWLLIVGITVDLGVLAFYKYSLFVVQSALTVLGWGSIHPLWPLPSIILPLGISFFTFEFLHYLVDVYKGHPVVTSPLHFALFAGFFPTQIAGPIKRYEQFVPQIEHPQDFDWNNIGEGLQMIVVGLFKKVALADNLAPSVATGFNHFQVTNTGLSVPDAWFTVVAFAFQIYFDFSGYTDIGRGSALILGYRVPPNFNRPYLSRSVGEFWRRWHMSLSTWLRDYLYIPLGGNRHDRYRNLMITMTLGGLWHGANWTFVLWGILHGAMLSTYHWFRSRIPARFHVRVRLWSPLVDIGSWALTFVCVCIAWVLFRASTVQQAWAMLGSMFGWYRSSSDILLGTERLFIGVVVAGTLALEGFMEWQEHRVAGRVGEVGARRTAVWSKTLVPAAYVVLFAVTLIAKPSTGPRFIYFQF